MYIYIYICIYRYVRGSGSDHGDGGDGGGSSGSGGGSGVTKKEHSKETRTEEHGENRMRIRTGGKGAKRRGHKEAQLYCVLLGSSVWLGRAGRTLASKDASKQASEAKRSEANRRSNRRPADRIGSPQVERCPTTPCSSASAGARSTWSPCA